jgi:hypothetical protein
MLEFLTDAPAMWLRQMSGLGVGVFYADATWDTPAWADQHMRVVESDAMSLITGMRDAGFRVEAWRKPKPMIADPVAIMAAARVDRERGGSAPTAAWTR